MKSEVVEVPVNRIGCSVNKNSEIQRNKLTSHIGCADFLVVKDIESG